MKTTNNNNSHACKTATLFVSLLTFCAIAMAQPQLKEDKVSYREVEQAFNRLDAFMNDQEESLRYVAPVDENVEIEMLWKKLEVFADNCERKVRYSAPETDEEVRTEYASSEIVIEAEYIETAEIH